MLGNIPHNFAILLRGMLGDAPPNVFSRILTSKTPQVIDLLGLVCLV
jgi:hypothetical protein